MRTTLIVGYPGETDEQFQTLLDFVREQEFDHVGVFTYSPEPGTKAVTLDLPAVPAHVAEERRNAIMEAQQAISLRKNQALVGQTLQVLIEAVGSSSSRPRTKRATPSRSPSAARGGTRRRSTASSSCRARCRSARLSISRSRRRVRTTCGRILRVRDAARPVAVAAQRRRVSAARSRGATRPERRGQGARVPMATLAGTAPTGRG